MLHLDVRTIPPRQRHPEIFRLLEQLEPGTALRITNDHDPKPLRFQVDATYPGMFSWTYCPSGPEEWIVEIARLPS